MTGGEKPKKIGEDGEKIMREFLKLAGWGDLSMNKSFTCSLNSKHKLSSSNSDKQGHNIDGVFHYASPLNHSETDIILCSAKHNQDAYSDRSKGNAYLKDLAYSLECAPKDFTFGSYFESQGRKKMYKGVLFWISSNREEQDLDMIDKMSGGLIKDDEGTDDKPKLRGIDFNSIYFVDNKRATFILSAIKSAQALYHNLPVNFLYPHTGFNNSEDVKPYGRIMPVQFINSSILPIVIEDGERINVLIFCNSNFDREYLKRLIWLAHKICGLANAVTILFNDYDTTPHESEAQLVKQLFQDSPLTPRIKVSAIQYYDFVLLKEEQRPLDNTQSTIRQSKQITTNLSEGRNDLDRILPYGEMIKPIIVSSILSESDIKSFLIRKGIYIGNKEKEITVPLLSTLLLSPEELNVLKFLLKAKEDKIKSVSRKSSLGNNNLAPSQIAGVLVEAIEEILEDFTLPKNCTFHKRPEVTVHDNEVNINLVLEKQNTNKDLVTGKQYNEGVVSFKITENEMDGKIDYTSREVYSCCTKIFKKAEQKLLSQDIISERFITINFDHFTNQRRIEFFLNFMNMRGELYFDNPRLEHLVMKPDETLEESLPFDLESLKGKVNELSMKGKDLDSVHYFEDEYKKALIMQKAKIKFDFNRGIESGICIVELDFKNALEGEACSELHFNLEIQKSKNNRGRDLEKLAKELTSSFNSIIQKRFKEKFLIVEAQSHAEVDDVPVSA